MNGKRAQPGILPRRLVWLTRLLLAALQPRAGAYLRINSVFFCIIKKLVTILSVVGVWLLVGPTWAGEKIVVRPLETIVIDPGHGGQDRGVKGLSGLQEKDLCLALAHQLAEVLSQRLGVRVILTRSGDYSLSPYERAGVANHQRADLFISLHFNADFSGQQRGMEIYILGQNQAENIAGDTKLAPGATLWNQAQWDSLEQSYQLAQAIYQQAMNSLYIKGVRLCSAPLLVLEGASMPAMLMELAYLSHHQEEEGLWDEGYKSALVELLYQGILSYKRGFASNSDLFINLTAESAEGRRGKAEK